MAQTSKEAFMNQLQKVGQKSQLSIHELFTDEFLSQYTPFDSIQDTFDQAQWPIASQSDFDRIDKSVKDQFIRQTTQFDSWQAMVQKALDLWLDRLILEYHEKRNS